MEFDATAQFSKVSGDKEEENIAYLVLTSDDESSTNFNKLLCKSEKGDIFHIEVKLFGKQ